MLKTLLIEIVENKSILYLQVRS